MKDKNQGWLLNGKNWSHLKAEGWPLRQVQLWIEAVGGQKIKETCVLWAVSGELLP